jgi:hypothetical protein
LDAYPSLLTHRAPLRLTLSILSIFIVTLSSSSCDDAQPTEGEDAPCLVGTCGTTDPTDTSGSTDAPPPPAPSGSTDTTDNDDTSDNDDTPDTPDTEDAPDLTPDVFENCGYGDIVGRVCSPNGSDWLFGVDVSVETTNCAGQTVVIQALTDNNGFYRLTNVPNGQHTLSITTGSFSTQIRNVPVNINETTDLTGQTTKTCLDRRSARIAVLTGVFDSYESVLESLGVTYSLFEGDSASPSSTRNGQNLLLNPDSLQDYDILIINSGEWYRLFRDPTRAADLTRMTNNIIYFVEEGGSLYVSDWAYYWIERTYPDRVDFFGDDSVEGPACIGSQSSDLAVSVDSDLFQSLLGQTDTTISFSWPAWAAMAEAHPGKTTVHLSAPLAPLDNGQTLSDAPMVISFQPTPTSGTVFFSSFNANANDELMDRVLRFLIFQL